MFVTHMVFFKHRFVLTFLHTLFRLYLSLGILCASPLILCASLFSRTETASSNRCSLSRLSFFKRSRSASRGSINSLTRSLWSNNSFSIIFSSVPMKATAENMTKMTTTPPYEKKNAWLGKLDGKECNHRKNIGFLGWKM